MSYSFFLHTTKARTSRLVIEQLMPVLDSVEGMEYEVIVVDDDSPDRTWEIALWPHGEISAVA